MATTASKPQLLKVSEAAALLKVSEDHPSLDRSRVDPLPEAAERQLSDPPGCPPSSLRGNYDLGRELRQLDERNANVTDEQVLAALSED